MPRCGRVGMSEGNCGCREIRPWENRHLRKNLAPIERLVKATNNNIESNAQRGLGKGICGLVTIPFGV